jgi:3-hydroxy-9,10-secoandrosta-1,3,5(10)-triene-9,17-dione monooxygenase
MTAKLDLRIDVDTQGRRQLTHPQAASISPQTLIERARALVPVLLERAARTEAAERLLPETVSDFIDAGFFRIVQPRRFGGFEFGIDVLEEVVIEVGRGCGSSAWTLAILAGHSWLSGLFTEEGQQAIFGDEGHVIMATNLSGNGRCRRVPGGYELSGRFIYLSGCDVANWLCVGAMLEEEPSSLTISSPSARSNAPWFYMAIRPEQASIQDDWHVLGLRGTGSKSVLVDRVFVPEPLALPQAPVQQQEPPGRFTHANPFYAAPMGPSSLSRPQVQRSESPSRRSRLWRSWRSASRCVPVRAAARRTPFRCRCLRSGAATRRRNRWRRPPASCCSTTPGA